MNSMILHVASLTHQLMKDGSGTAVKSEKGGTRFLPIIQKSMSPHARKPVYHAKQDAQMELISKDGWFYIESLRKALLAKGESLQNMFLSTKDLPVIRKLLCQCGFSDEDIERFLQELLKDNPSRQISLTEFFDKVAELNHPTRELDRDMHLDSGAIPYIEAALRDCGLTPKQLDPALSAAREKSGDLSLKKLANALKGLSSKPRADDTNQVNKLRLDRFVGELDDAINRTALAKGKALGDRITVGRDFVEWMSHKLDSAEKNSHTGTAGEPRQGNQLPADISKTINQIKESVGASKKEDGPIPPAPSLFQGKEATRATHQNVQSLSLSGKNQMSNELESGRAVESRPQDGQYELRFEAGLKEAFSNASGLNSSEGASGVSQNQKPAARGFLPAYLIQQVGRQIARSLLGGQRVVRLQLKPPELGMVKVEMDIKEHVLKLGMITENSSVKELLLSNAHELRDTLAQQGVKLERLDVQINYDSGQSLAHSKEDPGEEQKWIRDADDFIVPAANTDEDSLAGPGALALSHHVLDLII
jgi:flagellar hook-length control protein FliK